MRKILITYQVSMTFEMEVSDIIKKFGNDGIVDATCERANDEIYDSLRLLPDWVNWDVGSINIQDKINGEVYYNG